MEFTGRLTAFPAANLIQWAATERVSGTLVVRRSQREKRVLFLRGRLVACRSNQVQELYGQHLLAHGYLTGEALAPALGLARARRIPLGVALVALALLDEWTVRSTLARSMQESVQDLFLWPQGLFYFEEGQPAEPDLAVDLSPAELVLEGTRWMDELARIRGVLVDDGVVVRPAEVEPELAVGAYERRLLGASSPETSLADLWDRVGGVHFPFLAACFRLVQERALEIVRSGPDRPGSSAEIDLRELLLSLEGNDGVVVGAASAIFPLDVIEGLVPAWVRPPEGRELADLSAAQRAFLEGIDGRTTLRRLLSPATEARADQMELLFVEIRRRNIVLLPAALDDVQRRLPPDSPLRRLARRLRARHG